MNLAKAFILVAVSVFLFGSANAQTLRSSNLVKSTSTQCLSYEPSNVALRGRLVRETFVNASDTKETMWIIKLAAPVCVKADANNDANVAQENITEVQLVLTPEMYDEYRAQLNKTVDASGTLFGAQSQHHFTKVLLDVKSIKGN